MARVKDDYRSLTGQEKAAIFMLSLGEDHSGKLFEMMDDEDQLSSAGSLVGTFDSTERLLRKALSKDRVAGIMEEIRGPAGRTMWDKLDNVHEAVLANYFKNEYPQTIAVVLSKIRPDHAARVLSLLPENYAMEVIMRLLRMEAVQKEVLESVEKTLRSEFMTNLARTQRRDTHELMADIFNNLDRNTENRFITALEERNRESAERIKALMFTFDDLVRVDQAGIQVMLRSVEKDKLAMALKGGAEAVRDLFFENMSERAGKMMREDMEAMGPVRLRDVDEAQAEIVIVAKQLADAGEINISTGGEEDELVF
jgi:flagellar motor switch protein FliG